jgi:drug/metabolite transporter (DMT)-like permease
MRKRDVGGSVRAIIASVCYATNPLFALPLYALGLSANSVLFYRYLFSVIIYSVIVFCFKKVSLAISLKQGGVLLFLGVIFALTCLLMYESFNYIDSGMACTMLFVYPIMVAVIMAVFFKEKFTLTTFVSLLLSFSGICLLCETSDKVIDYRGVWLVVLSALFYALYIVAVKKIPIVKTIKLEKLNFYIMLVTLVVFYVNSNFGLELQMLSSAKELFLVCMLAIVPTIFSIETMNVAIKLIGSTRTSIIGALEPITAVVIGALVFGEIVTYQTGLGILLVITGVLVIVIKETKNNIKKLKKQKV